jgi:pimeloyl-ACP methyl ester carboxylesterase
MTTVRAKEKHVSVNGVRLRYLDWGNAGKTPMICLHGHTGQAHIWDEFAEAMSDQYHVLALDQRGHGQSERASTGYDRDRFVEDLDAFIDALGFDKVVLVGLSMGGWHSLLYAGERHPEKVERMIIVDIGPESSEESRRQWGSRPPTPLEFASLDEAFTWAREGNPWVTDESLRRDLENRLRQESNGTWRWRADESLFTTPLKDGTDQELISRYWRALETIPCPILEVCGQESPLLDDSLLERMKKTAKQFSWISIPKAGHVVTVDRPQDFIQATRSFLSA